MIFRTLAVGALAATLGSQAHAQSTPPADGLSWSGIRPTLRLADGNFTMTPVARLDLHAGSYFGQPDGLGDRFSSGANMRRGRLGLRGTAAQDFSYNFTWEFGPSTPQEPPRGGRIFEASIAYKGINGVNLQVGAWTLPHTLAYASSSSELLTIERPSITAMATSVASGDTRFAAGGEVFGKRFYGSAFATQGVASTPYDNDQRGVVGRAAWLALDAETKVQLGFNGAFQADPGSNSGSSQRFRDYPELRLNSFRYIDTRSMAADSSWAYGPELSGMVGKMHYAAEYQIIGIDTPSGPSRSFDGWYLNLAYPLLGEPRRRADNNATWRRGRAADIDFNQNWGALEAVAGYSTVDLSDSPVRGGRQSIWTAALNWYPTQQLKLTTQYQNGSLGLPGRDRDFQSLAFAVVFSL
ncbi:OprO/OprP family phosphate-selective porin [Roseomonas sp. USHLN139]|uniref:OprO/OprP family phosphate-selective porin n=1 Tax=Roseomonas sp. USHLN139 TaxID=3081298 RepID=UPI003B02D116